jgi:hypothetical protein
LEWGVGLEDLADVYFRVYKNYIVARSNVYLVGKIFRSTSTYMRGRFIPHEIDMVAFKNSEILLIQCTQTRVGPKKAEKMEKELNSRVWDFRIDYNLPDNIQIKKCIVYTEISQNAKESLRQKKVELISAKEMLNELIMQIPKLGSQPEPIIWLLQTLYNNKMLKQN